MRIWLQANTVKTLTMQKKVKKSKKLSPSQMKIARLAPPFDKITGADFKKLRKNKKG